MKAVALTHYLPIDDPNSFLDVQIEKPQPRGRDILVAIRAISVNPIDTKLRAPKDKIEEIPRVLGFDASGVVEAVGEDVTLFNVGDEVFYAGDINRPGTNSEFHLVDERIAGFKPKSLNFAEAGALPLTSITAYECLFDRLKLDKLGGNKNETLLIIGGAGGVGSIAIQLARHAGLQVIATASRPETREWVRELGCDQFINHREPMVAQVRALGFEFVDHIAIFNDMGHWSEAVELIRPQGGIVTISNFNVELPMEHMKTKSASLHWEFMFTRAQFETHDMIAQHHLLNDIAKLVDDGKIRSTLREVLSPINAANMRRAHKILESGATIGKVVVEGF